MGDDWKSTIGLMVQSALDDKVIVIYGRGDNLWGFVYVGDIYQIIQSKIDQKKEVLMNVATGKSLVIK